MKQLKPNRRVSTIIIAAESDAGRIESTFVIADNVAGIIERAKHSVRSRYPQFQNSHFTIVDII